MPFLLDENAAISMFFSLVLEGIGLVLGLGFCLYLGAVFFVARARSGWGKGARFALLLLATGALGFLGLLAIINTL